MDLDLSCLYFRVDATEEIGIGHFMRCFALGQYWRDIDRDACFIGQCPPELARRLEKEGMRSTPISESYPDSSDIEHITDRIPARVPVPRQSPTPVIPAKAGIQETFT